MGLGRIFNGLNAPHTLTAGQSMRPHGITGQSMRPKMFNHSDDDGFVRVPEYEQQPGQVETRDTVTLSPFNDNSKINAPSRKTVMNKCDQKGFCDIISGPLFCLRGLFSVTH